MLLKHIRSLPFIPKHHNKQDSTDETLMGKHIWLFFSFIFDKGVGNNNIMKVTGIFKFKFCSLCHHLSSEFVLSLLLKTVTWFLFLFWSKDPLQWLAKHPSRLSWSCWLERGVDTGLLAIYLGTRLGCLPGHCSGPVVSSCYWVSWMHVLPSITGYIT